MALTDTDAEGAVRLWLMYVDDAESLKDEAEIKKLSANVDKAKDPIDRLKAVAALRAAQRVDPTPYREGFIKHARKWAETNGVAGDDFLEMGVSPSELADAGFETERKTSTKSNGQSRSRAPRVSTADIADAVMATDKPFTLAMIRETAGGSPATLRKVIVDQLMNEEGKVRELEESEAPEHDGRGRAPKWYVVKRGL